MREEEKTLYALFRRLAHVELPSRFAALLQLCAPLAIQCWTAGWHRTAGWLGVASMFGIWALAQQRLVGHSDELVPATVSSRSQRRWRRLRSGAAVIGSIATLVLVLEAFAQVMAGVFKCPGCAG